MGLTSEADLVDLRAMDTAEDVIVRFVRHEMHSGYPNSSSGRPGPVATAPRNEWRFDSEAEFSDGSKQWMLWAEAKQMAALDTYAAEHKPFEASPFFTSARRFGALFHCHTSGLLR